MPNLGKAEVLPVAIQRALAEAATVSKLGLPRKSWAQPAPSVLLVAAVGPVTVHEPDRAAPSNELPQPWASRRLEDAGAPPSPAGFGCGIVTERATPRFSEPALSM